MATSTPWGMSQHKKQIAKGIVMYDTASHGGIYLSIARRLEMPEHLRLDDGWYEEDCNIALVVTAFPQFFTDEQQSMAKDTLRNWHPDRYEKQYNEIIPEGESLVKDERRFYEVNKDNWLVISALNDDENPGMVRVIATMGGERGLWGEPAPEEKTFLIPVEEYHQRGRFPFVVDPTRHSECQSGEEEDKQETAGPRA